MKRELAASRGYAREVGGQAEVEELRFGTGSNPFLASEPGSIFVTDLGPEATSGQLNQIGVFGEKQNFAISFSEEDAFSSGARVRGERPDRGIYSVPGGCTIRGACVVRRVR
ncbi:MAG TPA: hypothetical protein VFB39_10880 [Solirubrobacteraceae bacterium]|nr:hypothetical protein [Solirubrobacteraceae bacterium]